MDNDLREQISRLEAHIEELAEAIDRCRKVVLMSQAIIAVGAILVLAMMLGAIRFDPTVMIAAIAAVLGGTVLFGSNKTTSEQTTAALRAAEAHRAELIGEIDLRLVGDGDDGTGFRPI